LAVSDQPPAPPPAPAETPAPEAGAPLPAPQAADAEAPDVADPAFERFVEICLRLAGFDEELGPEWIDGYLTAVAVSWRPVPLDEVLPLMCGDAFERAFADPADVAQAREALEQRLHGIRRDLDPEALADDPDVLRLSPFMQVWDDAVRRDVMQDTGMSEADAARLHTGALWAIGFLDAVEDFGDDWPAPSRRNEDAHWHQGALDTIGLLTEDPAGPDYQDFVSQHFQHGDPTRDELIDEACFAVQDLRLWWLAHPPRPAPRRVEAAPGRNDPCPCGSGRKFKKCHGA
jgi:uncharacterized protein